MLYDYEHCWSPSKQDHEGGLRAYAAEKAGHLSEKSHVFLSQRPSGEGDGAAALLRKYCLSHFRNLPPADTSSADELATLLAGEMSERIGIHEVDGMEDMMICLQFMLGISIYDWAYYHTCLSQYMKYLKDPEAEPIQLYPEEQNALELEELLRQERILDSGYLSPWVVRYLGDMGSFSDLAMAYALKLLDVKAGNVGEPDRYVVKVKTPGIGEILVFLGNCHELDSVIQKYLDPGNGQVRVAVKDKLRNYLNQRIKGIGIDKVIEELRQAAEKLDVPKAYIDTDSLNLAMRGVIYRFIGTM
jgi:hypothetical protein